MPFNFDQILAPANGNVRPSPVRAVLKSSSPAPQLHQPRSPGLANASGPDQLQPLQTHNDWPSYGGSSPFHYLWHDYEAPGEPPAVNTNFQDSHPWEAWDSTRQQSPPAWADISDFAPDSPSSQPSPSSQNFAFSQQSYARPREPTTNFGASDSFLSSYTTAASKSFSPSEPIDLTQDAPSPPMSRSLNSSSSSRKRPATTAASSWSDLDSSRAPPRKKRRASGDSQSGQPQGGESAGPSQIKRTKTIEEIDLVEDDDISATLQKQREEAIRAQQRDAAGSSAASKLKSFQCTVCLDTPTDLTATACGHAFCRTCLLDWLVAGEKDHPRRSNCPACRKLLNRSSKKTRDVIPLEIMTRSAKSTTRALPQRNWASNG